MRTLHRFLIVAMFAFSSAGVFAADTIKVALIDALSGPYADMGYTSVRQYQGAIAEANKNGGALGLKLELIPLDDKGTTEQALNNLELVIQQGIRYVTQGNNPEISVALAKAIDAHNRENPKRAVLFLNYGDGAPELNDEQCGFWHFRFDASIAMKLRILVAALPADDSVKSIYLLNQDDAWGHGAGRAAQRMLSEMRPEIQIVGDEVHPVGKVKDFSAYLARIVESGADAILTTDRGADLVTLMRAARKVGGNTPIYIASTTLSGVPAAIGAGGVDRVSSVFTWHSNIGAIMLDHVAADYRAQHNQEWDGLPSYVAIQMLVTSMELARSTEPLQVASVLQGLSFLGASGPTAMRSDNHQLLQPLFVATLANAGPEGAKNAVGDTGLGWQTVVRMDSEQTQLTTTCKLRRPDALKQTR